MQRKKSAGVGRGMIGGQACAYQGARTYIGAIGIIYSSYRWKQMCPGQSDVIIGKENKKYQTEIYNYTIVDICIFDKSLLGWWVGG